MNRDLNNDRKSKDPGAACPRQEEIVYAKALRQKKRWKGKKTPKEGLETPKTSSGMVTARTL